MKRLTCLLLLCLFLASCAPAPLPQEPAAPTATVTMTATATATPTITPTPTRTRPPATATNTPLPTRLPLRTPQAREALPTEGVVDFQILHWNDFHAALGERMLDGMWLPGAARLAYVVKQQEQVLGPGRTLILDGGDWLEGAAPTSKAGGLKVLEFYQFLGVDAVAVGNHELFLGTRKFIDVLSLAPPLEILSANLRRWGDKKSCSDNPLVNPYAIFELGEASGPQVRVAVIGAGRHYLEVETYGEINGICFKKPSEEIIKIYDQMIEQEKPDVLVVVSHSGLTDDRTLAEELNAAGKPVDIIIGGHGHTWMEAPERIGKTYITQAWDYGRLVGVFNLQYNRSTGRLAVDWQAKGVNACTPSDPATLAFLSGVVSTPTPMAVAAKDPAYTYLVDLPPAYEQVGYSFLGRGVYPFGDNGMAECGMIVSHDQPYPYGLFAHASSDVRYALDGAYTRLETEISIKETACGDGAEFAVYLDGREIYRSPKMTSSNAPVPLSLDITGGKNLQLITNGGDDIACDWTVWGNPYLK